MIDSSCDLLIVGVLVCAAIALLIWFGAEDEAPKPENIDTLFRGKKCSNCLQGEVATEYPHAIRCRSLGKSVEAHHSCEDWS